MESKQSHELTLDVEEFRRTLQNEHKLATWDATQAWFNEHLGENVEVRAKVLAAILLTDTPFEFTEDLEAKKIDKFHCLQGDIICSSVVNVYDSITAFNEGENYFYILIPASCSANRYKFVLTARLIPIDAGRSDHATLLKNALLFKTHKYFYLPPLEEQDETTIGNLAHFEEISYIVRKDLVHARRVTSLSEIGLRMFNAFLSYHFTRISPEEDIIRSNSTQKNLVIEVDQ